MIFNSPDMEMNAVLQTAARMCAAARTAPKTYEKDQIHTLVLTEDDKDRLASRMEELGTELMQEKMPAWYGRDAGNVKNAQAVVLIGAEKEYRGVPKCGFCGFANCGECKASGGNCGFAYVDLGIAVSSAVSTAMLDKVDNRIMFSIGKAAETMEYAENMLWLGIPLSVSGKDIFHDRKNTRK